MFSVYLRRHPPTDLGQLGHLLPLFPKSQKLVTFLQKPVEEMLLSNCTVTLPVSNTRSRFRAGVGGCRQAGVLATLT